MDPQSAVDPISTRGRSESVRIRIDLGSMLEPDFRAAVDPRAPLRTMAEVYGAAPSKRLLHRMLWQVSFAGCILCQRSLLCTSPIALPWRIYM